MQQLHVGGIKPFIIIILQEKYNMTFFRKTIAVLALVMATMTPIHTMAAEPVVASAPSAMVADNTKGLYVVLTDADPMTQMMALILSTQTLDQGKSVQILLCGPAASLAVKNSKQIMFKPLNKSPQMMLSALIAKGVQVEVCAVFLPNSNKTEADLIAGVGVAKPPVAARNMRADGIKLFTF
jgi:predicted peroxiredoxin